MRAKKNKNHSYFLRNGGTTTWKLADENGVIMESTKKGFHLRSKSFKLLMERYQLRENQKKKEKKCRGWEERKLGNRKSCLENTVIVHISTIHLNYLQRIRKIASFFPVQIFDDLSLRGEWTNRKRNLINFVLAVSFPPPPSPSRLSAHIIYMFSFISTWSLVRGYFRKCSFHFNDFTLNNSRGTVIEMDEEKNDV